ncbi:molybdopterin-dependent oxidoreductase [Larsenimonas rhizosphaerae]|uniref:Molybdopterin-dependent oxidoreductase n=1 Tax=Larsenimonas rhizosphaerae TaxID=2944682 RepID=A0AA42CUI8_9GAMM|nr:molybdopterin-dependent oxidoreductase [Larsenimonas rhizosphaerae]MCX2524389.1 molybdopterin-dependent oxidoreductase [Larsenimonas rhizosphaerae]
MAHSSEASWFSTHLGTWPLGPQGTSINPHDPAPGLSGEEFLELASHSVRVQAPMVRRGWRSGDNGAGRGADSFEPISWAEATRLVADELQRVAGEHGNDAIYAGSYGWGSAGRFHHAQSQIKRMLNLFGGFSCSEHSYSYGAGAVMLPHVLGAPFGDTNACAPGWDQVAAHTDVMLALGGFRPGNTRCDAGGVFAHTARSWLEKACRRGMTLIVVSPDAADAPAWPNVTHIPLRPTTDTALMLGLIGELEALGQGQHDFLSRYCTGHEALARHVLGEDDGTVRNAAWAAEITGMSPARIEALARQLAEARRPLIAMSWSLQRARFGEQPCWAAVSLAAWLGHIGAPGGGVAFGLGSVNSVGQPVRPLKAPGVSQGINPVSSCIPVAGLGDMLASAGQPYRVNGDLRRWPRVRLIYWAGGNPFHHHQDLNRLRDLWKRPDTVIVHEPVWSATAQQADIVLPVTLPQERSDISGSSNDRTLVYSPAGREPQGQALTDHAICARITAAIGQEEVFRDGRSEGDWLAYLYAGYQARFPELPSFEGFTAKGAVTLDEAASAPVVQTPLAAFVDDPVACPLSTPSGRIELYSATIAAMGLEECGGHPAWQPPEEWLGSPLAARYPFHLLSPQPLHRLHSQLDKVGASARHKQHGREVAVMARADGIALGLIDGQCIKLFNDRGACLAGLALSDTLMPGVIVLPTGAWFSPSDTLLAPNGTPLERAGNPNVLTADRPTSELARGCAANSCLVAVTAATAEEQADVP